MWLQANVEKGIWDMGEERLQQSISNDYNQIKGNSKKGNNTNSNNTNKETEDDGLGGLLNDLFGF